MQKAQLHLAPVYIITSIIFILILVFGYNSIFRIKETESEVSFVVLKSYLERDVKSISADYGSVKTFSYSLPEGVEGLCFSEIGNKNPLTLPNCPDREDNVAKIFTEDNPNNNVFLIGNTLKGTFKLEGMSIQCPEYMCFKAQNSRVSIKMEGLGNKALIKND